MTLCPTCRRAERVMVERKGTESHPAQVETYACGHVHVWTLDVSLAAKVLRAERADTTTRRGARQSSRSIASAGTSRRPDEHAL